MPAPRFHTVKYAGVLAPASTWRSRIAPKPPLEDATLATEPEPPKGAGGYRPWAELLARTFAVDVLACPTCQGRMKLLALVKGPASAAPPFCEARPVSASGWIALYFVRTRSALANSGVEKYDSPAFLRKQAD